MKTISLFLSFILMLFLGTKVFSQGIIIDHTCAKLEPIPASGIEKAKQKLHIAYAHTSHGSQLIKGMTALIGQTNLKGYKGDIYRWNEGGNGGALDIDDRFISGDLGHNGDVSWANRTRTYLASNPDVNVVMYSWCGGCSDNTPAGIQAYLDKMNELEQEYPHITFVYMTGHRDIWHDATLKANNKQIRDYCVANNKVLYDFADIESYNPDGTYFEYSNDNCDYYSGAGTGRLGNWAEEWQNTHTEGVDWYDCHAAHSKALNGNLKAYAAWWLWWRLADKQNTNIPVTGVTLLPSSADITVGKTCQLTATVEPSTATDKSVTWSSGNNGVATVDNNGLVTAVAAGTATITVTTSDGSHTADCAVTVNSGTGSVSVGQVRDLSFYPNPVHDILYIESSANIYKMEVFSLVGRLIDVVKINGKNYRYDMANLTGGYYLFRISTDKGIYIQKAIKQ